MAIFGFLVPPDCGEKVTLEITILMALTFYMTMVTDMVPQSSETPLIGIYFACIMIMVATSTVRIAPFLRTQRSNMNNLPFRE